MKAGRMLLIAGICLLVAGCKSPSLKIKIVPATVDMESVTVDGEAAALKEGLYQIRPSFERDETTKKVQVVAESKDGVVVERNETVTKEGESREIEIEMPAEVSWSVKPASEDIEVRIDGELVNSEGTREILHPNRNVEFQARSQQTGVEIKKEVRPEAGKKKEEVLDTTVAADFKVEDQPAKFDTAVTFDASASTPVGAIEHYEWDFGDGETEESTSPVIKHTYALDPSRGTGDQIFTVALTVRAGHSGAGVERKNVQVKFEITKLAFDMAVYPSRQWVRAGNPVQIKLTPRNVGAPESVEDLVFEFGDGTSTERSGDALRLEREGAELKPILLSHVFDKEGRYEPRLTYTQPSRNVSDPQEAQLVSQGSGAPTIVVPGEYLSDEALKEQAWLDFYAQFKALLKEAGISDKRLALTSKTSANFEIDEPEFIPVVDRLTRLLVEDDEQFVVLEKTSQILARLAPEAIVDLRSRFDSGDRARVGDYAGRGLPYLEKLDYGLLSASGAVPGFGLSESSKTTQLTYGLKIAGTEDTIKIVDSALKASSIERTTQQRARGVDLEPATSEMEKQLLSQWLQNMPILMARFDTAEALIALEVIEGPNVVPGPNGYDEQFGDEFRTRCASVKVHVRLVDRNGRILRAVDMTGSFSQAVPRWYEAEVTGEE